MWFSIECDFLTTYWKQNSWKKNKKEGKWINEVPGLHFWYTLCWLCNEMCVDHLYRRSSLQIICLVIYYGRYKMICIDCGAKKIGTTKFWVFLARYCSIPQGPRRACCISSAQIMTRPWLLISPFHSSKCVNRSNAILFSHFGSTESDQTTSVRSFLKRGGLLRWGSFKRQGARVQDLASWENQSLHSDFYIFINSLS